MAAWILSNNTFTDFINGPWFKVIPILIGFAGLFFGFSQWRLRRADQRQKERDAEERRKEEQRPPDIYNATGQEGPIRIGGFDTRPSGIHRWGIVTIVNPTNRLMKISPEKLQLNGVETDLRGNNFHFMTPPNMKFERISLRAGDKGDYHLFFVFPLGANPINVKGELWLSSDNCPETFPIAVEFV